MKKIILLLLSIFILSCSKKEEFLVFGTNDMFPPFAHMVQDEIIGFDVELAKEIAKELGVQLKIINMSFDELIPAVASRDIDMAICSITITDKRQEIVDFSNPYYEASQVAIIRKEDIGLFENIHTKEELGESKSLSAQVGTTGALMANQIAAGKPVLELDTWGQALIEVSSKKVDAAIIDMESAKAFTYKYSNLIPLDIEFPTESYGVAINKGNSKLLNSVNSTIANLIESGRYDELVKSHIDNYKE